MSMPNDVQDQAMVKQKHCFLETDTLQCHNTVCTSQHDAVESVHLHHLPQHCNAFPRSGTGLLSGDLS